MVQFSIIPILLSILIVIWWGVIKVINLLKSIKESNDQIAEDVRNYIIMNGNIPEYEELKKDRLFDKKYGGGK